MHIKYNFVKRVLLGGLIIQSLGTQVFAIDTKVTKWTVMSQTGAGFGNSYGGFTRVEIDYEGNGAEIHTEDGRYVDDERVEEKLHLVLVSSNGSNWVTFYHPQTDKQKKSKVRPQIYTGFQRLKEHFHGAAVKFLIEYTDDAVQYRIPHDFRQVSDIMSRPPLNAERLSKFELNFIDFYRDEKVITKFVDSSSSNLFFPDDLKAWLHKQLSKPGSHSIELKEEQKYSSQEEEEESRGSGSRKKNKDKENVDHSDSDSEHGSEQSGVDDEELDEDEIEMFEVRSAILGYDEKDLLGDWTTLDSLRGFGMMWYPILVKQSPENPSYKFSRPNQSKVRISDKEISRRIMHFVESRKHPYFLRRDKTLDGLRLIVDPRTVQTELNKLKSISGYAHVGYFHGMESLKFTLEGRDFYLNHAVCGAEPVVVTTKSFQAEIGLVCRPKEDDLVFFNHLEVKIEPKAKKVVK